MALRCNGRELERFSSTVLLLVLMLLGRSSMAASDRSFLVYVGTYTGEKSKGIYAYRFNATTGSTTPIAIAAETENPSFIAIHPSGRFLYAVNEVDQFGGKATGAVSAFALNAETGKLTLLNQVASKGQGPAHLSLDKTGKYVLVANYGGGSVAVFPVSRDGQLGEASAFVQHAGSSVNHERQAGPHAHAILVSNDNQFSLVADLGLDELLAYKFDVANGSLAPTHPQLVRTAAGAGPRHIAIHPNGEFVYAVNELDSTVSTYSFNSKTGALQPLQTLSTLPKDFTGENYPAEIQVDSAGKHLYLSNREHDSIGVFGINPRNGTLSPVQDVSTGGKKPRSFAIDPTGKWLFAANQESDTIVVFRIDSRTGRLTPTSHVLSVPTPVCVVFTPAKD